MESKIIDRTNVNQSEQLIEKLWAFYKKNITENKDFETFKQERHKLFSHDLFIYQYIVILVKTQIVGIILMNWLTPKHPNYSGREKVTRINLIVDKDHRNKGYAGKLLFILKENMEKYNLEIIESVVTNKDSIDWALNNISAKEIIGQITYKLELEELKRSKKLNDTCEKLQSKNESNFEFKVYQGSIPEPEFMEYVKVKSILRKDVPRGSMVGNDFGVDPDVYKKQLQEERDAGKLRLIGTLRNKQGKICAITEIVQKDTKAHQRITGVVQDYRGKGLAKQIKACMIDFIMQKFPDIKFIETECAPENHGMIHINETLGFVETGYFSTLQLNIDEIK